MGQHRPGIGDDEAPPNQHSRGVIVYAEMISPSSLLRSDRFARSKATVVAASQGEDSARVWEQVGSREDKASNSACGGLCQEIEAVHTIPRRGRATVSASSGGFNNVRQRGKAPSKVRPMTTVGTTPKVRTTLGELSTEQNGENYLQPCQATPSPQKMSDAGSFTSMPAFETDSDAAPSDKTHSREQICCYPSVGSDVTESSSHRARLSQSPLRAVSTPFTRVSSRHFQQFPMRSKFVLARETPDQMARKVSEPGPSSQVHDEWSSRCFNLTQQIVEHLQSWNQSLPSDRQISTSPIMSSRSYYSSTSLTSRDWVEGKKTFPDPVSVTRTLLDEFDKHCSPNSWTG